MTLRFGQEIPKVDEAKLTIRFIGQLSKEMCGLYRTTYLDDKGKRHTTMTTHFEPTGARRMFPCFDEPKSKATFSIRVVAEARFHVLSNMPPVKEDNLMPNVYPPMRDWTFQKTPLMSTYLLAITMGEWDRVERKTKNGALVRVWAPLGCAEQAEFASEWAVRCLDFYDAYFACPYVLPKLDLVPVENFPIGAMENWGCIMFAKRLLLVTPEATARVKANIKMIVAHELAHMWFGNLVTPRFWNSTWLKEGFATYFAYFAGSQLEPNVPWQAMYLEGEIMPGKALDALASTHALEMDVTNSGEAREVFDTISYCKGASMISMLESYLGADAIRDGLREYVSKHKYKNAASLDLWIALGKGQSEKGPSAKDLMKDWIRTQGYPLVSVERVAGDRIRLTQSRHLLVKSVSSGGGSKSGAATTTTTTTEPWIIPILVQSSTSKEANLHVIEGQTLELVVDSKAEWVLVNAGQRAFVRVHYQTPALQSTLLQSFASFSDLDRLGVLDDQAELVRSGKVGIAEFFSFLAGPIASQEKSPAVWMRVCQFWKWANKLWSEERQFVALGAVVFARIWDSVGAQEKPGEDSEISQLRAEVFYCFSLCKPKDALKIAHSIMEGKSGDLMSVPNNMRGSVWSTLVRQGDKAAYSALVDMASQGKHDDVVVELALKAIQQSPDPQLVEAHFALALPSADGKVSSKIKSEMVRHLVRGAVDSSLPGVRDAALSYVIGTKWKELLVAGGGAAACAERLIAPFAGLANEQQAAKLKSWANSLDPETKSFITKTVAQIAEEITSNASVRAAGAAALKSVKF